MHDGSGLRVLFFQKLFPFPWVNDPRRTVAAAAGGCMLVRVSALRRIGGIAAIRGALIDDCALARAIKPDGAIWLGLSGTVVSLRPYRSLGDFWRMIVRSAFEQLDNSVPALLGTVLGMVLIYGVPPVTTLFGHGIGQFCGGAAWLLMAAAFRPTGRLLRPSRRGNRSCCRAPPFSIPWPPWIPPVAHGWGGAANGRAGPMAAAPDVLYAKGMTAVSHMSDPESAAHAEAIARRSGSSFLLAMKLLESGAAARRCSPSMPFAARSTISPTIPAIRPTSAAALDAWRAEIDRLFAGEPTDLNRAGPGRAGGGLRLAKGRISWPSSTAWKWTRRIACASPTWTNFILLTAIAWPARWGACRCACSASMTVREKPSRRRWGEALQLTNILRDLAEDAERDRLYLPADLLARHGDRNGRSGSGSGASGAGGGVRGESSRWPGDAMPRPRMRSANAGTPRCVRRS